MLIKYLILCYALFLTGCGLKTSQPEQTVEIKDGRPDTIPVDISTIKDAVPIYETWSASVNPDSYWVLGKEYKVLKTNTGYREQGIASWYGTKFHAKKTATGDDYDMYAMTAAHKTLPIPSYVRVTNLDNQRSIIVRVNDRGPFHEHRIIDLSYVAAVKLGLDTVGTGFVEVVAVQADESSVVPSHGAQQKHYLQVGAFQSEKTATSLRQKIVNFRLASSRIIKSVLANRTLYKVQIGPIFSVSEADALINKLKDISISSYHFISE